MMCARIKVQGVFIARDELVPTIKLMRADGPATRHQVRWSNFCQSEKLDWWKSRGGIPATIPGVELYQERNGAEFNISPGREVQALYFPSDPDGLGEGVRIVTRSASSFVELAAHRRHPVQMTP